MTTITATPPAAPASKATRPLFTKAYRATGYCRVGVGDLASGTFGDAPAHLVLPVEQVMAVDARTRMTGAPLNVTVTGPDRLRDAALRAALALGEARNLRGDIRLAIRTAGGVSGSTDFEATAAATLDAISKAEELSLSNAARAAILRDAGLSTGLAHGVPAIVDANGNVVASAADHGRISLLVVSQTTPITDPATPTGTLCAPAGDMTDPEQFTQWLIQCGSGGTSAVLEQVEQAVKGNPAVAGVIGGHGPQHPVVVLLHDSKDFLPAQQLNTAISNAIAGLQLREKWRVGLVRTVAHSASA